MSMMAQNRKYFLFGSRSDGLVQKSVLSCDLQFGLSENDLDCDDIIKYFPGSAEQEARKCFKILTVMEFSQQNRGEDCDDSIFISILCLTYMVILKILTATNR